MPCSSIGGIPSHRGNRIGPQAGKGAAGRYGGKSANHFYTHFDVEDIGEAFTISDWLPVDEIPLLAVKMRSQMSRRWWLHQNKKRGVGGRTVAENGVARALADPRDARGTLKEEAAAGRSSPSKSPSGDDDGASFPSPRGLGDDESMPHLGQPGLRTPQWAERAYHALYSTRIPVSENKTPWGGKARKAGGRSGVEKERDDDALSKFLSLSTGHDFVHGQRIAVEEFRALEVGSSAHSEA